MKYKWEKLVIDSRSVTALDSISVNVTAVESPSVNPSGGAEDSLEPALKDSEATKDAEVPVPVIVPVPVPVLVPVIVPTATAANIEPTKSVEKVFKRSPSQASIVPQATSGRGVMKESLKSLEGKGSNLKYSEDGGLPQIVNRAGKKVTLIPPENLSAKSAIVKKDNIKKDYVKEDNVKKDNVKKESIQETEAAVISPVHKAPLVVKEIKRKSPIKSHHGETLKKNQSGISDADLQELRNLLEGEDRKHKAAGKLDLADSHRGTYVSSQPEDSTGDDNVSSGTLLHEHGRLLHEREERMEAERKRLALENQIEQLQYQLRERDLEASNKESFASKAATEAQILDLRDRLRLMRGEVVRVKREKDLMAYKIAKEKARAMFLETQDKGFHQQNLEHDTSASSDSFGLEAFEDQYYFSNEDTAATVDAIKGEIEDLRKCYSNVVMTSHEQIAAAKSETKRAVSALNNAMKTVDRRREVSDFFSLSVQLVDDINSIYARLSISCRMLS
jgi:hypothetical protein